MKPSLSHLRMLLLGFFALALACQDSPGPTAVPGGARYQTTTINGVKMLLHPSGPRLSPAGVVTVLVDGNGGVVATDGGSLSIPAGALAAPVAITMRGPQDGLWAYGFGPTGLQFTSPATLEIHLGELGIDPSRLKAAGASDLGNDWQVIDASTYDPERGVVVAPIEHFSQYGLCID